MPGVSDRNLSTSMGDQWWGCYLWTDEREHEFQWDGKLYKHIDYNVPVPEEWRYTKSSELHMAYDVMVKDRVLDGPTSPFDCPQYAWEGKTMERSPGNAGGVPKTTFAFAGPDKDVLCVDGNSTALHLNDLDQPEIQGHERIPEPHNYAYSFWVGSGTDKIQVYLADGETLMGTPESQERRWWKPQISGKPTMPSKLIIQATGEGSEECYDVELHFRAHHVDASGALLESYDSTMIPMTVMRLDLDIDSDNDGAVEVAGPVEDSIEDDPNKPGKLIRLNDDGVKKQSDLAPIILDATPSCLHGSPARWKITYPVAKVKVWASADECDLLTYGDPPIPDPTKNTFEGKEYHLLPSGHKIKAPTPAFPYTLYVEGVGLSSAQADVKIKAEYDVYNDGVAKCTDEVLATVMDLDLKEVAFSGADYFAVKLDDDSSDYTEPHWQDNSSPLDGDADDPGDRKYPVCYTRNKKMAVSATFQISPAVTDVSSLRVRADGPGSSDIPATPPGLVGTNVVLPPTETSGLLSNYVDYLNPLALPWEVSLDAGSAWLDTATSENEVFVVLGVPACSPRFRTVLYLACKNTGGTDGDSCLANTWASFAGPANVCAWNETAKDYSRKLHYYQDASGHGQTRTNGLLKEADGNCHAWAHMLNECLLANNISTKRTLVTPPAGYDKFGVGNIVFDDASPDFPGDDPWKYSDGDLDREPPPAGGEGIPGQNMSTPKRKLFARHWIVHRVGDTVYYDPSYGKTTTGPAHFTASVVAAWGVDWGGGIFHWKKPGTETLTFDDMDWP